MLKKPPKPGPAADTLKSGWQLAGRDQEVIGQNEAQGRVAEGGEVMKSYTLLLFNLGAHQYTGILDAHHFPEMTRAQITDRVGYEPTDIRTSGDRVSIYFEVSRGFAEVTGTVGVDNIVKGGTVRIRKAIPSPFA